ncbi:3'-N-debenzoyl-2'-deoxytaxol N-benzoyltransferase [Ananas comosus]|uniref:3'-N-debenzoyl-2'-deoxytaxol N-benzoyltransferase n=1 Tax=Ananas comosus TaxID=4615 RepID=A0A199UHZ5_ANACO|nr:3'-N-debenzoyl-2'-deoxytaxol N-benzoyltransferase [Ananas comosus]
MGSVVTKSKPLLIAPSKPTPRGKLSLSPIDKIQILQSVLIPSIHVFAHGDSGSSVEIVNTIKQAISEALVLYYPLAGRLVDVGDGDLCIECNGEGLGFVEASADCSLEDVNFLEHPSVIPLEELVVDHRGWRVTDPPVVMQVTKFTCGGFAVGFAWHHSLSDGTGAAQFLNAVGELARGLPRPTVNPIWARDSLLDLPPKMPSLPLWTPNLLELRCSELNMPLDYVNRTKENFFRQIGQSCTTFDVALATIWQCRTRAIGLEPTEPVQVYFAVNVREMLQAQPGYYGNSIFIQTASSTSQEIAKAPIVEIIKIIRSTKGTVSTELAKWKRGLLKCSPMEHVDLSYNTLGIAYWKNLGFEHVDYGSGHKNKKRMKFVMFHFGFPFLGDPLVKEKLALEDRLLLDASRKAKVLCCISFQIALEISRICTFGQTQSSLFIDSPLCLLYKSVAEARSESF